MHKYVEVLGTEIARIGGFYTEAAKNPKNVGACEPVRVGLVNLEALKNDMSVPEPTPVLMTDLQEENLKANTAMLFAKAEWLSARAAEQRFQTALSMEDAEEQKKNAVIDEDLKLKKEELGDLTCREERLRASCDIAAERLQKTIQEAEAKAEEVTALEKKLAAAEKLLKTTEAAVVALIKKKKEMEGGTTPLKKEEGKKRRRPEETDAPLTATIGQAVAEKAQA